MTHPDHHAKENLELRARISEQEAELAKLRRVVEVLRGAEKQVKELEKTVQELKDHIAKIERASKRQAAPFRSRASRHVPADQKKSPGRVAGHAGSYRQRTREPDESIAVPLDCCPDCNGRLSGRFPVRQYIEEIIPARTRITELVTWEGECEKCGKVSSRHPLKVSNAQGAAKFHLGPRALATAALLNKHFGLTMSKTCRVLKQLAGLSITPGGLSQALDRVADRLEWDYQSLRDAVAGNDVVYADETSWWVGKPGHWLWVFCTKQHTYYAVRQSRGSKVIQETLGEDFDGILVSDCYGCYDLIDCRKHKCIGHHLQAIAAARDRPDTEDPAYLDQWKALLQRAIELHHLRDELASHDYLAQRLAVYTERDQLLNTTVTQSGDLSVQKRLAKQVDHLFTCLEEPNVDPTNNQAERQLRPAVIARKISCGNKTDRGRRTWEILASLAATCHQHSGNFADFADFVAQRVPLQAMQAR